MNMASKDINDNFKDTHTSMFVKGFLAKCIMLKVLNAISTWYFNIVILFASPAYSQQTKEVYENLKDIDATAHENTNASDEFHDVIQGNQYSEQNEAMYRSSLFYKLFDFNTYKIYALLFTLDCIIDRKNRITKTTQLLS